MKEFFKTWVWGGLIKAAPSHNGLDVSMDNITDTLVLSQDSSLEQPHIQLTPCLGERT